MKVLIVDDERSARLLLRTLLEEGLAGVSVQEAASLAEARAVLERESQDVALVDIRLSPVATNRDGLELLRCLRAEHPATAPIVVTVSHEMQEIRAAMRAGAYSYILKDELCEELVIPTLEGLHTRQRLEREVHELRSRMSLDDFPVGFVGQSAAMERLRAMIRRVARSERPVLIVGPTGSGKELVVRAIHALGPQPEAPVLDLNCGAIPEQLIESQLFGHERGAFTGADRRQPGYFSAAGRGTLFLDEIAELPLTLQAKLLRVLETGRFRSLGSLEEKQFEGRVLAATHADLEERVRERRFREDLLYRLNVLIVRVPGLEERREDIPALVAHFAARQSKPLRFSPAALDMLIRRRWPGNVRELRNLVDRVAVFSDDGEVTPHTLEEAAITSAATAQGADGLQAIAGVVLDQLAGQDALQAVERALIAEAMVRSGGRKTQAAELLGVHRKVIERRLSQPGSREANHDEH